MSYQTNKLFNGLIYCDKNVTKRSEVGSRKEIESANIRRSPMTNDR